MSHIRFLAFALFITALAALSLGSSRAQPPASEPLPTGWKIFPTPVGNSDAVSCANYSRQEWRVSFSETGTALITPNPRVRGLPQQPELPPGVKSQKGMFGFSSSVKIKNGWLLGFNGGEWGGGLWLAYSDGNAHQITDENVRGFVETSRGILIFVGLAHLSMDSGKVLLAPYTITSESDLKTLIELDGAPDAFAKESADTALVVTTQGISRITSTGAGETLLHHDLGILYPDSIVSAPDGVIYATMRLFVVRLVPHSGKYAEQWLVPNGCEKLHIDGFDCACGQ